MAWIDSLTMKRTAASKHAQSVVRSLRAQVKLLSEFENAEVAEGSRCPHRFGKHFVCAKKLRPVRTKAKRNEVPELERRTDRVAHILIGCQ